MSNAKATIRLSLAAVQHGQACWALLASAEAPKRAPPVEGTKLQADGASGSQARRPLMETPLSGGKAYEQKEEAFRRCHN